MFKIVWRFNLKDGVNEDEFFQWLKANVWPSSAAYGCETKAFRLNQGPHAFSTEAVWPSDTARQEWVTSPTFQAIPPYPGTNSPWGAQVDLDVTIYREIDLPWPE